MPAPPQGRVARAYAAVVVWLRWPIVAVWIAACVYALVALPTLGSVNSGPLGALVPEDAAAIKAEQASVNAFGYPLISRTMVVQRNPDRLTPAEQLHTIRTAIGIDRDRVPHPPDVAGAYAITNGLRLLPFASERGTTAITYLLFHPDTGAGTAIEQAQALARGRLAAHAVGVTGTVPARGAYESAITGSLDTVTLATVLLVLVLVGVRFRSVVAPLIALAAIAASYVVAIRLLAVIAEQVGLGVPQEVQPVIVVLLFGVGTDYAVFYLDRCRHRLGAGDPRLPAIRQASAELMPIVPVAGLTVVLATAALVISPLDFFRAFGPGMAFAVLVALVVALTLVPALLAILGRRAFWPAYPAPAADAPPAEERPPTVRLAARWPVLVSLVCLALLGLAISGLARIQLGGTLVRGLPSGAQARQAYQAAAKGFVPGVIEPTLVLVQGRGVTRQRAALTRLQRELSRQPDVAGVIGPADDPLRAARNVVLARSGDAARYMVVYDLAPYAAPAIDRVDALTGRLPALMRESGLRGAHAQIAGDTALTGDTVTASLDSLARILPVALGVILLVLIIFLRGLILPLCLVFAATLAPAAALGAAAYVFQGPLDFDGVTYYVPVATLVLLLALGSDYNVYVVGRVFEEARVRPLRDAVLVGAGSATRAVSTAGLALAGSFALLAIVPLIAFRQVAFVMVLGLLLDAFLVRTFLVPALIVALSRVPGWPGRRLRAAPAEA